MKVGVEDAVESLGFEHSIILRPGLILGKREAAHSSDLFVAAAAYLGPGALKDRIGQEAEVIGRAAVHAALLAQQGKAPSKHWILDPADILRLGRDEWKF
jgi:uncharacterized protein YbjT (DUF2867 family)